MIRQLGCLELAEWIKGNKPFTLLDVRQPVENETAALPNSQLIPLDELVMRVGEIEQAPGVPLVVYCHHGVRSLHAGSWLAANGFDPVYSLSGGIDAWSQMIDPGVPRY
jgi:rhodanese-related sulfurtransferase